MYVSLFMWLSLCKHVTTCFFFSTLVERKKKKTSSLKPQVSPLFSLLSRRGICCSNISLPWLWLYFHHKYMTLFFEAAKFPTPSLTFAPHVSLSFPSFGPPFSHLAFLFLTPVYLSLSTPNKISSILYTRLPSFTSFPLVCCFFTVLLSPFTVGSFSLRLIFVLHHFCFSTFVFLAIWSLCSSH